MVFAGRPAASSSRLAARPVGAPKAMESPFFSKMGEETVDDGRLARARSARDDEHLGLGRLPDRFPLSFRQRHALLLLDPRDGAFRANRDHRADGRS